MIGRTRRCWGHGWGFTLVEIMIVFAIITILVSVGLPGWIKSRERARSTTCQENLQKIDQAKELWALEYRASTGDVVEFSDLVLAGRQGYLQRTPYCPAGGSYTVNVIGTVPECSVGTDTSFGAPPHTLP